MHVGELLVQVEHFFGVLVATATFNILSRCLSLQFQLFTLLLRLGELVFELHAPALLVVQLMLPDHLLALQ